MKKTLLQYNFGDGFIDLYKLLYCNIKATIANNGLFSDVFNLERGVRQGCPLSPYLFILTVELLAATIRNNNEVKGIKIGDFEQKINLMADDTLCFASDKGSVHNILNNFKDFEKISGLKINIDKCSLTYLGTLKNEKDKIGGIPVNNNFVETLGIKINGDENHHFDLNFKEKLENLKKNLEQWKKRKLSIKGKITILNNLALSPLLYCASTLYTENKVIQEVKKLILNFIWDGGTPKIKYVNLIQPIDKGGLGLIDIESKINSILLTWVPKFCYGTGNWKAGPVLIFGKQNLLEFFHYREITPKKNYNKFYNQIFSLWKKSRRQPLTSPQIQHESLWFNYYMKINNRVFVWKKWLEKGIFFIKDIIVNGEFCNEKFLYEKFNLKCNYLEVMQLMSCIPKEWRQILKENVLTSETDIDYIYIFGEEVIIKNLKTKLFYNFLIKEKYQKPIFIHRWEEEYPTLVEFVTEKEWKWIFNVSKLTMNTKVQSIQYKLLSRIINCGVKLKQWKINIDAKCKKCNDQDNLQHYFIYCKNIFNFWKSICVWWNNLATTLAYPGIYLNKYDSEELLLFGYYGNDSGCNVLNYVLLYSRYYIYITNQSECEIHLYDFIVKLKWWLKCDKKMWKTKNNMEGIKTLYNCLKGVG